MAKATKKQSWEFVVDNLMELIESSEGLNSKWASVAHLPTNVGTGHQYTGSNLFSLLFHSIKGKTRPLYVTKKALSEIVGETIETKYVPNKAWIATPIFKKVTGEGETKMVIKGYKNIPIASVDGVIKKYPELAETLEKHLANKNYTIDNGLDKEKFPKAMGKLQEIMDKLGVSFQTFGNRAYFSPTKKLVVMPALGQFNSEEDYLTVLAHEVGHATKLDASLKENSIRSKVREGVCKDTAYALEELVAEIFAFLFCQKFGVPASQQDSGAYLKVYLGRLEGEKRKYIYDALLLAQQNLQKYF